MPLMVAQHFMIPSGSGQFRYAAGETVQMDLWGSAFPGTRASNEHLPCANSLLQAAPSLQDWLSCIATSACVAVYGLVPQCCHGLHAVKARQ